MFSKPRFIIELDFVAAWRGNAGYIHLTIPNQMPICIVKSCAIHTCYLVAAVLFLIIIYTYSLLILR